MSSKLKAKLMQKEVPIYSEGEELFNYLSHLLGAVFGLFVFIYYLIRFQNNNYSIIEIISLLFYSTTIIILYLNSAIYHFIDKNSPWKRIFRLIDHNTIYWLIAGTYFPICVIALGNSIYGLIMMIIEFSCLFIGSLLNFFNMNKLWVKILTTLLYIVSGWTLAIIFPAIPLLEFNIFLLILLGGISYTIGVIFYVTGKKKKWMHSVFHIFCLVGTLLQFIAILLLK